MRDQSLSQIRAQGHFPHPKIALLTPKPQDLGQAEVVVIQSLRLHIEHPQRATIRIRMGIHKGKIIDQLQDEAYHKRLFPSPL